jgi:hypothetical protein
MRGTADGANPVRMLDCPGKIEPHQASLAIRSRERGGVIVVHRGSLLCAAQEGNPSSRSAATPVATVHPHIAPRQGIERDVVRIRMPESVVAKSFRGALVVPPVDRPLDHVMVRWIVHPAVASGARHRRMNVLEDAVRDNGHARLLRCIIIGRAARLRSTVITHRQAPSNVVSATLSPEADNSGRTLMTNLTAPAAPTDATNLCPACGIWVCDDCGALRSQANRFSRHAQHCPSCRSLNGRMEPTRHRAGRADDHESSYRSSIADGRALRYPLDATSDSV